MPALPCLPQRHKKRKRLYHKDSSVFIISAFDSMFYLTCAGFEPLERPFFLIIRPDGEPLLLTPRLDREHLMMAHNIDPNNVYSYWKYPAPQGRGWSDRLADEPSQVEAKV